MDWYKKSNFDDFVNRGDDFWEVDFDEEGQSKFKDLPYSGTQCTGYACKIRQKLGPDRVKIFGFMVEDNPTAGIGTLADGHDFAIVDDRYIIDPWLTEVENGNISTYTGETIKVGKSIFDMDNLEDQKLILAIYGHRSNWTRGTEMEMVADERLSEEFTSFSKPIPGK